jgi:hypothetical protein
VVEEFFLGGTGRELNLVFVGVWCDARWKTGRTLRCIRGTGGWKYIQVKPISAALNEVNGAVDPQ